VPERRDPEQRNPEQRHTVPFGRTQRLVSAAQFKTVFAQARRSSDRYFTVLALANDTGRARLGLAIGKKRIRRAVDRNRMKRLIRESFRLNAPEMAALDLVVISRFDGNAANEIIADSLSRHWAQLTR